MSLEARCRFAWAHNDHHDAHANSEPRQKCWSLKLPVTPSTPVHSFYLSSGHATQAVTFDVKQKIVTCHRPARKVHLRAASLSILSVHGRQHLHRWLLQSRRWHGTFRRESSNASMPTSLRGTSGVCVTRHLLLKSRTHFHQV